MIIQVNPAKSLYCLKLNLTEDFELNDLASSCIKTPIGNLGEDTAWYRKKYYKLNPKYVTALYWMPKYNACPVDFCKVSR